jgi:hypothetical protein
MNGIAFSAKVLCSRLTVHVGTGTHLSANAVNQELETRSRVCVTLPGFCIAIQFSS